jgi:hypothetical protein
MRPIGVAGRRLRKYRYARRLIIEAGRQTMPPGLWILWPVTPVSPARRLAGPGHGARRHHHRGCVRQRDGDEHPQHQDYFMEQLCVDHLSPRSDLFTPFTETIISCLS